MKTILIILFLHFVADFVLQSDQMAQNKSKSNYWLGYHVLVYMIPFVLVCGWQYALLNGVAHFAVDYCTSRISSRFWAQKKIHYFFVTIGFDQFLHTAFLLWSARALFYIIL